MPETMTEMVDRLKREHEAAVEGLRQIRDSSISWDDATHIAREALRECGVVPEPTFDEEIRKFLEQRQSLGDGLQRLAAGEQDITVRMTMDFGPVPQRLVDDLRDWDGRCASCERQETIHGPAGLCDGCLDALGDEAA